MIIEFIIKSDEDHGGESYNYIGIIEDSIKNEDIREIEKKIKTFQVKNPNWNDNQCWEILENTLTTKGYHIINSDLVVSIVPGRTTSGIHRYTKH